MKKHKMIADFEKLTYSSEMLRKEWGDISERFKMIINGGWTNESILEFIRYILKTEYAGRFFPGSSLGTLLISKPEKGHLNYQRTLAFSFDRQTSTFKMIYSDSEPFSYLFVCCNLNLLQNFITLVVIKNT